MKNCNNCANKLTYDACKFSNQCIGSNEPNSIPSHWQPCEGYEPDNVNHPSHYETGKYECFDVMVEAIGEEEAKGFCLCNAFKYIYRCKIKNETPTEDIKKAIWYLNKFVELEEKQDECIK